MNSLARTLNPGARLRHHGRRLQQQLIAEDPRRCNSPIAAAPFAMAVCRRRYHVAVIGSGPAGFYTTKFLMKQAGAEGSCRVDMFERLPTPFGLVRFGVAPDHPEVKNVINDFSVVAESPYFRYFGNVEVGPAGLPLPVLRQAYDAVVVCTGAEGDKRLGIPGEDLRGVIGAPPFVKWYNGHPDYAGLDVGEPGEAAVVLGQGNVALDVARIISRAPNELRETDIDPQTIDRVAEWHRNGLRTVHVVGRRGFVQAAFTNAELRELLTFSDEVMPIVDPAELALCRNPASEQELSKSRMKKRSVDILEKMAANWAQRDTTSKRIVWLRFLASPSELIEGSGDRAGAVAGIRLDRTQLQGEPSAQTAVKADESHPGEVVPCGLVVRSVGFGLTPLEGLPTDERKRVPHTQGRVVSPNGEGGGLYVSGWAKRGPQGIIGTNISDAQETAGRIIADLAERGTTAKPDMAEATLEANGTRVISFSDWRRLEAEEKRRGETAGRPTVKLTDVKEMLQLLDAPAA